MNIHRYTISILDMMRTPNNLISKINRSTVIALGPSVALAVYKPFSIYQGTIVDSYKSMHRDQVENLREPHEPFSTTGRYSWSG